MFDSPEKVSILPDLNKFYENYLVETSEGFIQIFSSFTYGEMVISFLLLLSVLLYGFKWIWEVLR